MTMADFVDAQDVRAFVYGWPHARRLGPRRQESVFGHVVSLVDTVTLVVSFWIAYLVRGRLGYGGLQPIREYLWVLAIILPVWIALARGMALTVSRTYRWPARAMTLTLRVHLVGGLILLSTLYLLKALEISRLLMQTFLIVSAVALLAERLAIHAVIVRLAERWKTETRRLLVVGPVAVAEGLQRLLRQRPHWGASVRGVISTAGPAGYASGEVPVVGGIADLGILDTMVFDEVVMADAGIEREHGDRIVAACLERGLTYHTLVKMPGRGFGRHHAEAFGDGLYLISLETTPQDPIALSVKRAIDIVGAMVGLAMCALVFVVFSPLIRFGSPGPVIFRQIRIGRNGRRFMLYKFRTMRSDAEAEKARLLATNEMQGHIFKLRDDPRVTPVGRFLRRTYLDELPQFWNVLLGEMSLVGTRPPTPEEVACYSPHHRRRLSVRPGITGLWQSHGNGRVSDFEKVVHLDCEYIDRWSILLDLKIMMRTCVTVVSLAGH